MKKLAILGRGTAGCYAITHFRKWSNLEIDWYFDGKMKPQSVGEGSDLIFPSNLNETIDFNLSQLHLFDGYYKTGIYKENWGTKNKNFFHPFHSGFATAIHFNASKFQQHIFERFGNDAKVNQIDRNVKHEDIDADFIMDCSGFSNDMHLFHDTEIPVNSVHVEQCFWQFPKFDYTLAIARPHGWVFAIPLKNRCSVGYLYNKNLSSFAEIVEDIQTILKDYDLMPSGQTNSFTFKTYYRKQNFSNRVCYNGNASFFLEPLEATSLPVMGRINRSAFDIWINDRSLEDTEQSFQKHLDQIQNMIMSHYAAGSPFDTPFWKYAQPKGLACYEKMMSDPDFIELKRGNVQSYSTWPKKSFEINFDGLGLLL